MAKEEAFQFTIESGKAERHYWMDIWRYRELFYILAKRDIDIYHFRKTEKTFADVI